MTFNTLAYSAILTVMAGLNARIRFPAGILAKQVTIDDLFTLYNKTTHVNV